MNLAVLLIAASLHAQAIAPKEAPRFKIAARPDARLIVVGSQPNISVEIKNVSKYVAYVDQSDLNITSAVSGPASKVVTLSETLVRADAKFAQPTPSGNWHAGSQTIGIPPGHSITKVHRLPQIDRAGKSDVLIVVSFPASTDIERKAEDWNSIRLTTNLSIRAQAKNP